MKNKLFLTLLIFAVSSIGFSETAYADVKLPKFDSCLNPQGKVIASYESGVHGVPGRTDRYTGIDKVYRLSDNSITQCLCPDNGIGIQTSWLKTSGYSSSEIDILKKQGWMHVITGSPWGLEDVPYLAKNKDYACREKPKAPPQTLNEKGDVLALANTGNTAFIYTLVISGALFLIMGMIFNKVASVRELQRGKRENKKRLL